MLLRGSQVLGLKLVSYGKFNFFRSNLDGNMLAKGKCLTRKAKCLSSSTKGRQFKKNLSRR